VINEVANVGNSQKCDGLPYIEYRNMGPALSNINLWYLHNDQYPAASSKTNFPSWYMGAGAIFIACKTTVPRDGNFTFSISPTDTISIRKISDDTLVSSTGSMTGLGSAMLSYQRSSTGSYFYAFPTAEAPNVDPAVVPTRAPAAPTAAMTNGTLVDGVA
jgi:hypothetical protein